MRSYGPVLFDLRAVLGHDAPVDLDLLESVVAVAVDGVDDDLQRGGEDGRLDVDDVPLRVARVPQPQVLPLQVAKDQADRLVALAWKKIVR